MNLSSTQTDKTVPPVVLFAVYHRQREPRGRKVATEKEGWAWRLTNQYNRARRSILACDSTRLRHPQARLQTGGTVQPPTSRPPEFVDVRGSATQRTDFAIVGPLEMAESSERYTVMDYIEG